MSSKKYYQQNREIILEKTKKYYEANKDKIRIYKREWCRKNKNKNKSITDLLKTDTWKGRRAELYALNVLKGAIDNNKIVFNQEYDLLWNGKRVDVKSCNLYLRKFEEGKSIINKRKGQWSFNKNKGNSDLYFCVCLIDNKPVCNYLIPKELFNNGITIGEGSSKFNNYIYAN